MTALPAGTDAALEPLRRAIRESAEQRAEDLMTAGARDAEQIRAAAAQQAALIRSAAIAAGETIARDAAAARSAQARRAARGLVLAAQREIADNWSRRAREEASRLREDPGYPDILRRLTARARAALGSRAVIREDPRGGLVAEAGTRRLDLTLESLADSIVTRLQQTEPAPWRE